MNINAFRLLLLILFCFYGSNSSANFDLALKHYKEGNFTKAAEEFEYLAKIGIASAQFNLGVMHYKGEALKQDPILGYAWMALAAQTDRPQWLALANKLYANFSHKQKQQANKVKAEIAAKYSEKALAVALAPELIGEIGHEENYKAIKKIRPNYPKAMLLRHIVGWSEIIFTIAKDGTTRNHQVLSSTDPGFNKVSIEAIKKWVYIPAQVDGKPVEVHGAVNRFLYDMDPPTINEKRLISYVEKEKLKIADGSPAAYYSFGSFISGAASYTERDFNAETPNHWYLEAAKSGFAPAEFRLGRNLLVGKYCKADTSKSLDWLYRSANHNFTDAQYFLAIEMISGARLKKDIPVALGWLNTSAELGNDLARLKLAWILSTSDNINLVDAEKATKLFDAVSKKYTDQLTYLEVAAATQAVISQTTIAQTPSFQLFSYHKPRPRYNANLRNQISV